MKRVADNSNLLVSECSDYDSIVHPNRIVVFNAYLLRHAQWLGPSLWWMVISFRQAVYNRSGSKFDIPVRISSKEISHMAGFNASTFWRKLADEHTIQSLSCFVHVESREPVWESHNGMPRQAANQYKIYSAIPLTGYDAKKLRSMLTQWASENSNDYQTAYNIAMQYDPGTLLPWNCKESSADKSDPVFIDNVVEGMGFSKQQIAALTEKIIPHNDVVVITHYFIENFLPQLKHTAALLVVLLRDSCYVAKDKRTIRNKVMFSRTEIMRKIGLVRERTLRDLFAEELLEDFVIDLDFKKKGPDCERTFLINVEEPVNGWPAGKEVKAFLNKSHDPTGRDCTTQETEIGRVCTTCKSEIGRELHTQSDSTGRECTTWEENIGRDCTTQEAEIGRDCTTQEAEIGRVCTTSLVANAPVKSLNLLICDSHDLI